MVDISYSGYVQNNHWMALVLWNIPLKAYKSLKNGCKADFLLSYLADANSTFTPTSSTHSLSMTIVNSSMCKLVLDLSIKLSCHQQQKHVSQHCMQRVVKRHFSRQCRRLLNTHGTSGCFSTKMSLSMKMAHFSLHKSPSLKGNPGILCVMTSWIHSSSVTMVMATIGGCERCSQEQNLINFFLQKPHLKEIQPLFYTQIKYSCFTCYINITIFRM